MPQAVGFVPEVEDVTGDEDEVVRNLNTTFDTILNRTAKDYQHAVRAVHAKAHAVLQGVLTVDDDLPRELAQGLFSRPGNYRAFMRVSTNAGDILPDAISLPRGLALKVCDVPGERLLGAEGSTQDFIMVNGSVFQTRTAHQFLGNLKMLAKTTDRLEGAKEVLSTVLSGVNKALSAVGVSSPKVQSLGGAPNVHPLGETYYSVTPFRYGDHIAKFSLKPVSLDLTALRGQTINATEGPDAIRDTLQRDTRGRQGVWEFRVQLCRDLERQPVEDPTVEWREDEAPFRRVALLTVPPQDSWDDAAVKAVDEAMRFSIWTGLAAHQPLGNINRARRDTYQHSSEFRSRFNACPIHEPS
jgi:hypothetical protein